MLVLPPVYVLLVSNADGCDLVLFHSWKNQLTIISNEPDFAMIMGLY